MHAQISTQAHPHINSDEVETYQERVFASKTTLAGEKPAAEEGEEDKAAAEKAAADKAAADKAMGKGALHHAVLFWLAAGMGRGLE